ncbi:unnamed protein product [Phytophthora fragariaefolia]|uniref:Unnamed protein product n=1 Tax=Phytophthora fragariaefolia TaxID=1490495 RepID=A0A9W7CTN1_9STRA|nr:unnamed protein product [Phytophthora fragariaefolia]
MAQSLSSATPILDSCMWNLIKIDMELSEGLIEILGETDNDDEDIECLLKKCLYGLKQASRMWNETIDRHLNATRVKPTKVDPYVYPRDDKDQIWVACLYIDDILIASRDQNVIISVNAQIAAMWRSNLAKTCEFSSLHKPVAICTSTATGIFPGFA